jgi:L-fuculose-phosphate aldolase
MYERGLVEGTAGNVSGRVDDGSVVVTPSSRGYAEMTLADLVVTDLDGNVLDGERSPTSEKSLHLECYQLYDEVKGVVHCHAIHASMFAVARTPIPAAIDEFIVYIGGDVPVGDYQASGTDHLAKEVASLLGDRSAALMANHGMVCVGKSVDDALHSALVVEHNARIMWGSYALGGPVPIPDDTARNFAGVYDFVRNHMWSAG